jgi:hypothetical protein
MAKTSGIGTTVSIDDAGGAPVSCENDITSITANLSRNQVDITGLDKAAIERMGLLADGKLTINAVSNPAGINTVLNTWASSDATRTVVITYPGPEVLTLECNIESYDRSVQNGENTITASLVLCDGTAPAWT